MKDSRKKILAYRWRAWNGSEIMPDVVATNSYRAKSGSMILIAVAITNLALWGVIVLGAKWLVGC